MDGRAAAADFEAGQNDVAKVARRPTSKTDTSPPMVVSGITRGAISVSEPGLRGYYHGGMVDPIAVGANTAVARQYAACYQKGHVETPQELTDRLRGQVRVRLFRKRSFCRPSRPDASGPFIFFVGFNKTGTRSFHSMLQHRGFASIHNGIKRNKLATAMMRNILSGKKVFDGFDDYFRAFSDMSLTTDDFDIQGQTFFRRMDHDYPGSYFIFNRRPIDKWVHSRMKHHQDKPNPLIEHYKKLYSTLDPDKIASIWIDEHEEHARRLRSYFGDRPEYCEIDIENDDVTARMSGFLGVDFAPSEWPHIGRTQPKGCS